MPTFELVLRKDIHYVCVRYIQADNEDLAREEAKAILREKEALWIKDFDEEYVDRVKEVG